MTATKYEDELRDMLKERTGGNKEKARLAGHMMTVVRAACDVLRAAIEDVAGRSLWQWVERVT